MGDTADYENRLFAKGKTLREVRKIMERRDAPTSSKKKTLKKEFTKKESSKKKPDKVFCEYCGKNVSVGYYKTHQNTINHLASVGRNVIAEELDQEKKKKKKAKKVVEKRKEKEEESEEEEEEEKAEASQEEAEASQEESGEEEEEKENSDSGNDTD